MLCVRVCVSCVRREAPTPTRMASSSAAAAVAAVTKEQEQEQEQEADAEAAVSIGRVDPEAKWRREQRWRELQAMEEEQLRGGRCLSLS
jgi:hypothetical protein